MIDLIRPVDRLSIISLEKTPDEKNRLSLERGQIYCRAYLAMLGYWKSIAVSVTTGHSNDKSKWMRELVKVH